MVSNTEVFRFCWSQVACDPYIQWWWKPWYYVELLIFWLLAVLPEKLFAREQSNG